MVSAGSSGLPVGGDVAHEQDAGVHVEVKGGGAEVAVDLSDDGGVGGEVYDAQREAEADEEVGGRQVLQEDGDAAVRLVLRHAEINPQRESVQDQTHLRTTGTESQPANNERRSSNQTLTRKIRL